MHGTYKITKACFGLCYLGISLLFTDSWTFVGFTGLRTASLKTQLIPLLLQLYLCFSNPIEVLNMQPLIGSVVPE